MGKEKREMMTLETFQFFFSSSSINDDDDEEQKSCASLSVAFDDEVHHARKPNEFQDMNLFRDIFLVLFVSSRNHKFPFLGSDVIIT